MSKSHEVDAEHLEGVQPPIAHVREHHTGTRRRHAEIVTPAYATRLPNRRALSRHVLTLVCCLATAVATAVATALATALSPGTSAAHAQQPSSALTASALDNATYRPLHPESFAPSVKLVNGRARGPGPFTTDIVQRDYVFGDLDGDGVDDAVATVIESLSGVAAGLDIVIAAYLNKSGVPTYLGGVDVGHATRIDSVTISNGVISVSGANVGPAFEDPFCCPNHPFSLQFTFDQSGAVNVVSSTLPAASNQPSDSSGSTDDADGGGASASDGGPPSILTDDVRADVLAAVDRANNAWTAAGLSLSASDLQGAVGGKELSDDLAELDSLRRNGQRRRSTRLNFSVDNVSLQAPGRAQVTTHEAWSEEIDDTRTGAVLRPTASASYAETYTVEFQDNAWIVTANKV